MRKRYSHDILVDRPVQAAFPLFTPKGEEDWVPGWKPDYFAPKNGETARDMVFATGSGADRTWWTCLEWEPERHHVRYFRLTPDNRAAFVDISCEPRDRTSTAVTIGYDIQALGPAGEAYLAEMSDAEFAAMIGEWPDLIKKAAARL